MSNTIIITWVRNGMALGTKWYGTRAHRYEMTRNHMALYHISEVWFVHKITWIFPLDISWSVIDIVHGIVGYTRLQSRVVLLVNRGVRH